MRARRELPNQERLRELFDYNPETGVFIQRIRTSQRVKVGSIAGTPCGPHTGITIQGTTYLAHRLAFRYMVGSCPDYVDHKNGDGRDNRWDNLRECTQSENLANKGTRKDSTSGFTGVSWSKEKQKWQAYTTKGGKTKHLGYFTSSEDAAKAYDKAALELHGEFARLNFPEAETEKAP